MAVVFGLTALPSPTALLAAITRRTDPGRFPGRRVWQADGRVHLTVRGVRTGGAPVARAVEDALRRHPSVSWATVNEVLGVAVVACPGAPPVDDLVQIVTAVEAEQHRPEATGTPARAAAPAAPDPTGTDAARHAAVAIATDLAGLSAAGVARLLRGARLPAELASVVAFVDLQPRLRARLSARLGAQRTEGVLRLTNAVAQALAQGGSGLAVDLGQRVLQLAEARARQAAWASREGDLAGDAERAAAGPVTPVRPTPLPGGAVERHTERMGLAALGAVAGGLVLPVGGRRAGAMAASTLPKAAVVGREAFAATLGRILARHGVVLTDPEALRRLDRIDTVVLDADVLSTDRVTLGDIIPTVEQDGTGDGLVVAAHSLFRPDAPWERRRGDGFELSPLRTSGLPAGRRAATGLAERPGPDALELCRGGRRQAVVRLVPEPVAAADALAAAARRAGLTLVTAGPSTPPGAGPTPGMPAVDRTVPGGDRLAASVRDLQAAGHGVLLVSRRRHALAVSDCGVGVDDPVGRPAWGAHVLVGADLTTAAMLVEAAGAATAASRRGVTVARVASALGAAAAVGGPVARVARRTLLTVDGAAAVALVSGAWSATEVAHRPVVPPVSQVPWHLLRPDAVLDRLGASPRGLTAGQAARRQHAVARPQPAPPSLARAFCSELANPLTPILAGGAALSASIGAVADAGVIVGVTAVSALVGAVQRTRTERAVRGLLEQSTAVARVCRDGRLTTLPTGDLVTGDVVDLRPGDVVPADCRILRATALEVDESSLTGESVPVTKCVEPVRADDVAERRSMVYESTTVAAGHGRAVVVAVGAGTEAGRSMAASRPGGPTGGVEARLARITRTTLPIALGSAGAVMAAGLLRGRATRDTVGAGVALAVASVPEGLPFLVSAAQLAAARRLSRRGAVVRDPRAVEALGRVDVLCFDKTGTLTEGRIALRAVSDGRHEQAVDRLDAPGRAILAAGLRATPRPDHGDRLAHSTDLAVRHAATGATVRETDGRPGWRADRSLPFEPSRGYHATAGQAAGVGYLSVKGAPELVIPRCTRWRDAALDQAGRDDLVAETTRLARRGYRVLAVAERTGTPGGGLDEADVDALTFVGFLMFADPVRATSAAAVRDLREAGVQVVMITGDHPDTAGAIATQLDALGGGEVVTGADLDRLDDAALDARVPRLAVVARGTPAHKVRVVRAFQRLGRTVAMTGDGSNDAAAIRLADVGIALGRRATPAARSAADVVVTDDRVETIVAALVEGRAMWGSVRRALGILVGGNLGEIGFTVLGATATGTSPLSARQLLLVNLLTDLAPALAVALRAPRAGTVQALLAEGPEASLAGALSREVALRAGATATGATGAWLAARFTGRARRARTVALVGLVGAQLGQTVLAGGRSPAVLGASAASAAALALVVQTPGVSQFFGCTPLGPVGWATAGTAAVGSAVGAALLGDRILPATRLP